MRKVLFIASLMLLSVAAFAQREVGTLSFIPKAGLNIAYTRDSEQIGVNTKPRLGLVCGLELEYQLMKRFSLSAGALYSMQGEKAKISGGIFSSSQKVTAETDYINFPVLANVYILKGLALKVGVQPAVNVKSDFVSDAAEGDLSFYGIRVKTFNLDIPFGLSYEYKSFIFEARYNLGVTNLAKDDDSKNRVVQITAGLKLGR